MTDVIGIRYNLFDWDIFPRIELKGEFHINDDAIQRIEYKEKIVEIGDTIEWHYEDNVTNFIRFRLDAIKLYPTLRFWSNDQGIWFLACNCFVMDIK